MGLSRLSPKRCFLYALCLMGTVIVVINIRQRDLLWRSRADQAARQLADGQKIESEAQLDPMAIALPIAADLLIPPSTTTSTTSKIPGSAAVAAVITQTRKKSHPGRRMRPRVIKANGSLESRVDPNDPSRRPWYMRGGKRRPVPALISKKTGQRKARLWPSEDPLDDRITNQLMYVPADYNKTGSDLRFKRIFISHGMHEARAGPDIFFQQACPVSTCTITRDNPAEADLIVFKDYVTNYGQRPPRQIWMLYLLECPYHTQAVKNAIVNWTATYRHDSDVVAPYERWQYHDPSVMQIAQPMNYALNKTKKVAWFVSNCHPRNQRMRYAEELSKHIEVDIYGTCGPLRCSRSQAQACFDMLDADYKFYLAFENSNCRDYITEKFFVNGLQHNVLPIVMGARPTDYARAAPYRSYIHVDEFEGPRELAEYLHRLDADDELYNSYFRWKGTGEFINTYFWCRVCAMLHDAQNRPAKSYPDVNEWWRGDGVCVSNSWRELERDDR